MVTAAEVAGQVWVGNERSKVLRRMVFELLLADQPAVATALLALRGSRAGPVGIKAVAP